MTILKNISGQKSMFEMESQNPEIQTVDADVSSNLQKEQDITTEVPISMNVSLPPCWVVLHRVTEKDLNRRYPDEPVSDHSNFELSSDSYDSFYQAFEKNCKQRRIRTTLSKLDSDAFEQYKKHREQFKNKRKFQEYSDGDFNYLETYKSHKRKKRAKRAKKYERDSEWNPSVGSVHGSKKRRVRRPAIESDSSSTDDEDELLFSYYMNEENGMDNNSTTPNTVPSDSTIDGKPLDNDLQKNHVDSNLQTPSKSYSDFKDGDILTGIMKEMDDFAYGSAHKVPKAVTKAPCERKVSNPTKRGRKRIRLSNVSDNIEVVAKNVIQQLVNKVCAEQILQSFEKSKNKTCKWCNSPFNAGRAGDLLCVICKDLGRSKYIKTPPNEIPLKKSPANKIGKKSGSTMSQMLKTLPINERQRLMYTEKKPKSLSNKNYDHNKSSMNLSDNNLNTSSEMLLAQNNNAPPVPGPSNPETQLNSTVKTKKQKEKSDTSQKASISECIPFNVKKLSTTGEIVPYDNGSLSNKISLKKFDERLFQISFPGRDDDLNISSSALQEENSDSFIGSCATQSHSTSVSPNETSLYELNSQGPCQTYLLPPVPTVLIANYSSPNDNGNYSLKSIFYQNEYTQKLPKEGSANPNTVSMTPILNTSCNSNQNISFPPSSFNNTVLSVEQVSLDNQIQSVSNSGLPAATSSLLSVTNTMLSMPTVTPAPSVTNTVLTMPTVTSVVSAPSVTNTTLSTPFVSSVASASSVTNTVLSMPIVSSVVNQCDKNNEIPMEDTDIFLPKNFGNSELQIIITSVVSETQAVTEENNQLLNENESCELRDNSQNIESTAEKDTPMSKTDLNTSATSEPVKNAQDTAKQISNISIKKDVGQDNSEKLTSKPKDAINSAIDLLGAISILAVMDIDTKSPHANLDIQIQVAKSKLNSEKTSGTEHSAKLTSYQYSLEQLMTARKFLKQYGSFSKVSEFLLRKHQMIQIKQEKMDDEEEVNQKTCRFSESSGIISSLNNQVSVSDFLPVSRNDSQATSHIEKLQSQIAAMYNAQLLTNQNVSPYGKPSTGTVHHFTGEQFSALAPTPITPKQEAIGEARETPSRGSGPRTPARPESATSQPDELAITALKKELMEVTTSSPSQCAFSQNPSLSEISKQIPIREMDIISIANSINSQVVTDSGSRLYMTKPLPQYNQNYSNVLLNLASKHSVSSAVELIGQPLCVPNVLSQRQTVPSVNNQYIIQPTFSNSHAVLLNASQVPTQNVNALLTNVSNQQFYTSSQVPQMFYPQQQLSSLQSNVSPIVNDQPSPVETKEQMYCAVCRKVATLRCKQCAKVAYCNTTCAKTYWHQRHKVECKPMPSLL